MNDTSSPYAVDIEACTVTHKQTGIVMRFTADPDGGWTGQPDKDTVPTGLTSQFLAGLARRMGDAWAMRQPPKGKS